MSFEKSYHEWLAPTEGGWCNVPGDKGGETYCGIARNFFPQWIGWGLVDNTDKTLPPKEITKILNADPQLQEYVAQFYYEIFWMPLRCDELHEAVAHCLFDFSVNSGANRGVKHLQKAVNASGGSVSVDGAIGDGTIAAAQQIDPGSLCQAMLNDRAVFYQVLVQKNPSQSKFLKGWMSRCKNCSDFINENYL